jgi:hypothetical protein
MGGVSSKAGWLTPWLSGVALLASLTLAVPGSRADARPRATKKTAAKEKAPASKPKRAAQRSPAKPARSKVRAAPRKPKAPEAEAQDVDSGPDQGCHAQLRHAGVSFVKVKAERAPRVLLPIRLTGPLAGIEIKGAGKNKATHYLDCRLGLALVRWAPQLKAAGVKGIDHYSIYRPDAAVSGTNKPSGHAVALAIDAGRFHMRDGRTLTVLDDWKDKTKGADPCVPHPQQSADERMLRELVCDASQRGIFQTVVTPHHNPEHDNHVHLEVSAEPAPTWIH